MVVLRFIAFHRSIDTNIPWHEVGLQPSVALHPEILGNLRYFQTTCLWTKLFLLKLWQIFVWFLVLLASLVTSTNEADFEADFWQVQIRWCNYYPSTTPAVWAQGTWHVPNSSSPVLAYLQVDKIITKCAQKPIKKWGEIPLLYNDYI